MSLARAAFGTLALWASACAAHDHAPTPPRSAAAVTDPRLADDPSMRERSALLRAAEAALASGNPAQALAVFERAAMLLHAADTEMGLVRAHLQAGEYRRALAFCAHTAGAHLDSAPASALYAWLLRIGGQGVFAQRVLGEAAARAPSDPVVSAVVREFKRSWPTAMDELLAAPQRMAPYGVTEQGHAAVPKDARVAASGVLMDEGRRALVPLDSLPADSASPLWVRNGLGRMRPARFDPSNQPPLALGVAVLVLAAPLPTPGAIALAPRDPFAGSPGFVVEYAASERADPAWPWLHQGFFGGQHGVSGWRRLGIDVPGGPHGGPVFDAAGRLAGIALHRAGDQAGMLPVSLWKAWAGTDAGSAAHVTAAAAPLPADEAYERALQVSLQLIVGR